MTWADAVVFAARGLVRRRGRAVLTLVAVALAAALLTALTMIAETGRTRVLDQLSRGGPLAGIRVDRAVDDADLDRVRALPDVAAVVPIATTRLLLATDGGGGGAVEAGGGTGPAPVAPLRRGGADLEGVVGVDLRQAANLPITVLAGRLPGVGTTTEVALDQRWLERQGVAQGQEAAAVGTEVQLGTVRQGAGGRRDPLAARWTRALVVGVVAQEAGRGAVLAPLPLVLEARTWTARGGRGPVGDRATGDGGEGGTYEALFVVANGLNQVEEARQQLTGLGLPSEAPENLIASVLRYLHVVELVLVSIGAIALVIAALGIANALLAAVRERRREIGVLKAIGARDRDVRRIFLLEALALGLGGGLAGTVLGWGIARGVGAVVNDYLSAQGLAGVSVSLPLAVLVGGILGSAVLALLAGTVPAVRAARLPARDAMGEA